MSAPGIDGERVERWLVGTLGRLRPPLSFERIGAGRSNLTFQVEDGAGRRLVLRRPPLGELLESAHDMGREYRVLSALAGRGVPVPRVLAICTDAEVTGASFYVMEHVEGMVVDTEEAAGRLSRAARARATASLAQALAAMHAVDVSAAGLGDFARHDDYAGRQVRRWTRQWEQSKTRELPEMERVAAALADARPPQRETTLVHGDYNLANVILGEDGVVRAILDWELCTLGDPVADVGTMLCYWPDTPEQATLERDPVSLLPGFGARADLVAAYAEASGRDLSALGFWTALATWRLGVILQGVYKRWLADPANGGRAPEGLGRAVDRMAALAAAQVAGLMRADDGEAGGQRPPDAPLAGAET